MRGFRFAFDNDTEATEGIERIHRGIFPHGMPTTSWDEGRNRRLSLTEAMPFLETA